MLISPKDNNFYNFRSELILKLKNLGHDVVLVCPYGKKIDYFTERGCRFFDLDIDRRGTSIFNDLKLVRGYSKLIKAERPDIVLTYTSKSSIYAGFVCGFQRVPYIVNNAGLIETTGLFDKFMKCLYWLGFRKASCLMFQNSQECDVLDNLLRNKVHYRRIPGSGVNIDNFVFTDYPKNDDEIYFNYVALIKTIKGIAEYLECARRIKEKYPHTHFRIYGEYDSIEYNHIIREYQEKGIVEYQGVKLDMKPEITSCHAVIHPSYYEGMTNVVLEHSSMGRVCLGSNIPGVADGIEDGKTGFLFEVKNVDSMVEAVEKFLKLSHEEKVEMGRQARRKMEQEFSREIVTNTYVEEVNKILEGKG